VLGRLADAESVDDIELRAYEPEVAATLHEEDESWVADTPQYRLRPDSVLPPDAVAR